MEIFLNLAWLALAVSLVTVWLRGGNATGRDRRGQLIAIAVLIAILFPVISVSDDLMAIQNPAETDNYQRRHHLASGDTHPLQAGGAAEATAILAGVAFGFLRHVSPRQPALRTANRPALAAISNRPPPAA